VCNDHNISIIISSVILEAYVNRQVSEFLNNVRIKITREIKNRCKTKVI